MCGGASDASIVQAQDGGGGAEEPRTILVLKSLQRAKVLLFRLLG